MKISVLSELTLILIAEEARWRMADKPGESSAEQKTATPKGLRFS
jgi:hypothetical protein